MHTACVDIFCVEKMRATYVPHQLNELTYSHELRLRLMNCLRHELRLCLINEMCYAHEMQCFALHEKINPPTPAGISLAVGKFHARSAFHKYA